MSASGAVAADDPGSDVVSIIESASPALSAATAASIDVDGDAAAQGDFGGMEVSIPTDPVDQISLQTSDGAALSIGLPFADEAAHAVVEDDGVVSYDNGNGSITVPVIIDDGSLAVHTIIESADSPTRYEYPLDLMAGDTAALDPNGAIVILSADGDFQFAIGAPWARDANGANVPTRYELTGNVLTQIVDLTEAFVFPVVADPTIGGYYMASYSWNTALDRITITPTFAGGTFPSGVVATYGWIELINKTSRVNRTTYNQQFNCHAGFNTLLWAAGQTWDLEGWRVPSGPWGAISNPCNW
jgi:hypothetical protein